jgi:hypothetical protein
MKKGCDGSFVCQQVGTLAKILAKNREPEIVRKANEAIGVTLRYNHGQHGCDGIERKVIVRRSFLLGKVICSSWSLEGLGGECDCGIIKSVKH